jgi:hypothetical protein
MFAIAIRLMNLIKTKTLRELDRIIHGLPHERQQLYRRLVEGSMMTPLRLLSPNSTGLRRHNIYLKLEYENDVGCHHRRLYPFVFALNEAEGRRVWVAGPLGAGGEGLGIPAAFSRISRFQRSRNTDAGLSLQAVETTW